MNADVFLDTNVLVYAAAGRGREEPKRRSALELIEAETFGVSGQVLQEFFVTTTRRIAIPLSVLDAQEWIDRLKAFPCVSIDHPLVCAAIAKSQRYRISYWDGAILAAAEALGAHTVYSEVLNSGQRYGSVRVINPFV